jgi:hypothetical protein
MQEICCHLLTIVWENWTATFVVVDLTIIIFIIVVDPDPQGSETVGRIRDYCLDPDPGQRKLLGYKLVC